MPNLGKSQNIIALAILIVKIPNTNGTHEKVITQGFIFALQKILFHPTPFKVGIEFKS